MLQLTGFILFWGAAHVLSALGELFLGSNKSALRVYDSSLSLHRCRVMLRRCLKPTSIGRSGCLFRSVICARKASVSVVSYGENNLDQLDHMVVARELV